MDPRAYQLMVEVEDRHWWWAGRRAILRCVLSSFIRDHPPRPVGVLFDLGCGTGANGEVLAEFGPTVGFDASADALNVARGRGFISVHQGDLRQGVAALGFPAGSGSVVLLADVLEHLDDEGPALTLAYHLLSAGGVLITTVPASPWLWGPADVFNGHWRRYTPAALRALLEPRFTVERMTYFNSLLFGPIALAKLLSKVTGWPGAREAALPPAPINTVLRFVLSLEARLLSWLDLPAGVSLLCVARKSSVPA